eukprot:2005924-Pyramimonas_sp.AAC.1
MHPDDIYFGHHSNRQSVITLDCSDGVGHFQVHEGVLQGRQSAPVKYIRSFDRSALAPWLLERQATHGGRDLMCTSSMNDIVEQTVNLSTT